MPGLSIYLRTGLPGSWIIVTCLITTIFSSPRTLHVFGVHGSSGNTEIVFCTTIETNVFYPDIVRNAPGTRERAQAMQELASLGMRTYVTCEPLIKFDLPEMVELVSMCSPVQVNIGRNSRQDITLPEPTRNEVQALITELQKFTRVVVKSNAKCWI